MRGGFAALSVVLAGIASADSLGRIQPDPGVACENTKPYELCFGKPTDGVARAEFLSEPFYAILLKTAARCSVTEKERLAVQALFPRSKVFSTRFYCEEDVEENISYTNVDEKVGFIAVYAGMTMADAKTMLGHVQATGKFPGANIRRMQAKLVYP
jgi:hypothetical protein